MTHLEDAALIMQLQAGDLEALGTLYDRYRTMVYRTTLAITGDSEAASDLLHDVFLRLNRYASHIDVARPLEPWLYRMATNLSYSWVKRNKRWMRHFEDFFDWLAGDDGRTLHEELEREEEWRQLQQALQSLPVQQRVVVVLYYLNDLSLQDISEIVEAPVGTVKSRLHYGRLGLRKSLGMADFLEKDRLPGLDYTGS
jgi:RNA polymerase sigma-70 factor (ECF subfamily)